MKIPRSLLPALLAAALLSSSCNTPKTDTTARRDGGADAAQTPATPAVNTTPAPSPAAGIDVVQIMNVEGKLDPAASGAQMAPNFTWKDGAGKDRSLKDYRGKVVMLNFWGTWCPPCRAELPDIVKLRNELQSKGFEVIGLGVNERPRNGMTVEAQVADFAKKNNLAYPLLIANGELIEAYGGLEGVPTTFIVNGKGEVIEKLIGMRDETTFRNAIKKAMS